jgi:hypothetical protein
MKVIHLEESEARGLLLALRSANKVCEAVGAVDHDAFRFPDPDEPAAPRIRHGIRLLEDELDDSKSAVELVSEPGT